MHRIRTALLALTPTAMILFGAGPVAADGYRSSAKPSQYAQPNWAGFFVGAQGGGGWGDTEHLFTTAGVSTGAFDLSGGLFGVTWGTNWQTGKWVYGTESDFSFSSIDGSFSAPVCGGLPCTTDIRNLSTSRLRLGYSMDRSSLVYVTGGLAYANVRAGTSAPGVDDDKTRFGWALGAGIEWALAPKWSLKAEYLHVDLGDRSNYSVAGQKVDVDVTADVVRVGVNYNFGPNFWSNVLGYR